MCLCDSTIKKVSQWIVAEREPHVLNPEGEFRK